MSHGRTRILLRVKSVCQRQVGCAGRRCHRSPLNSMSRSLQYFIAPLQALAHSAESTTYIITSITNITQDVHTNIKTVAVVRWVGGSYQVASRRRQDIETRQSTLSKLPATNSRTPETFPITHVTTTTTNTNTTNTCPSSPPSPSPSPPPPHVGVAPLLIGWATG
ncbi:hypothetical protein E2C01_011928 [Portunus trituberculatus]|uniref:Uncharacterized protein n=1 Tax=Portunus trituberculatus TaxID=210409 RepID=A0A5B7DCN3_PORTR|nr:hypothetical protein [Portunus trituberculatus]